MEMKTKPYVMNKISYLFLIDKVFGLEFENILEQQLIDPSSFYVEFILLAWQAVLFEFNQTFTILRP